MSSSSRPPYTTQLARRASTSRRKAPLPLPLLDDALHDREGLAHLVDSILELLAPRHLADHDGDERRVVAPRSQEDLGDPLELVARRLVRRLDGAEAPDELTPVLHEDRAEHVVLRGEVVVEEPVCDTGIARDVRHSGTVIAVVREDADRSVEDQLALLALGVLVGTCCSLCD